MDGFSAVPGSQRLFEQAAQSPQVGIDLQEITPGLLVFPTLHPDPQAYAPDELRHAQSGPAA